MAEESMEMISFGIVAAAGQARSLAMESIKAAREGKFDEASRLQIDYMPLIKALFCEVNPIPVKKAMELLGWQVGDVRLPLVGVTAEHEALLRRELDKMGCKI